MATIGLGIIGTGKHGRRYVRHVLRDDPGFRLVAVSRRDAESGAALAAESGCRYHERWSALVDDPEVEAVAVVVPPTLHLEIASAVADRGKALLVEKPLAPTGGAARELVRRVRAAGIPALMAHTLRWNSVVRTVRETLPALGALRTLGLSQRFEPSELGWLDDPAVAGGGLLLHTGVHSFDLLRFLTGREVKRVTCRTARTQTTATEDNFVALCELDRDPALVTISGSRDSRGRCGLIDVATTEAQLLADHQQHWAQIVKAGERHPLELPEPAHTVLEGLRAFAALIRTGTVPPVSLEDGAQAVLIAEACAHSARRGAAAIVEVL
jgi:predicted dehydrogenase